MSYELTSFHCSCVRDADADVLHRASCRGFTPYYYDLEILAEKAQYDLFRSSCRKGHCLSHLYTVKLRPSGATQLRTRGHDYELPAVKYDFNKRNFIVRSIFIMCDFVLFYCRCGVYLFECYSVKMCDCHV